MSNGKPPLTHAELGAMLVAIGEQMMSHDLSFGATFDGASDIDMKLQIHDQLVSGYADYDGETADEIADTLLALDPDEFITRLLEGEQ